MFQSSPTANLTESSVNRPLPKYDKPPVIEVALSVQFDRLDVTAAHLGLIWQKYRDRFPTIQEKPELESVVERFGPPTKAMPAVRFEVGTMPIPRYWFVSESGNELVQVQRDRFIRNWRKTEGGPDYPSYEKLRQSFVDDWNLFTRFVTDEIKASVVPNQCEVTYVNILEDMQAGELPRLLAWVSGGRSDDYLGDPEDAELTLRYILKDDNGHPWGRLHIAATPAIKASDSNPVIRLSLTARGAPLEKDARAALDWLDKGHEAVVRGFTSITTADMHAAWERTI
jgi:uncharacterized protein (TIGR04255 family)